MWSRRRTLPSSSSSEVGGIHIYIYIYLSWITLWRKDRSFLTGSEFVWWCSNLTFGPVVDSHNHGARDIYRALRLMWRACGEDVMRKDGSCLHLIHDGRAKEVLTLIQRDKSPLFVSRHMIIEYSCWRRADSIPVSRWLFKEDLFFFLLFHVEACHTLFHSNFRWQPSPPFLIFCGFRSGRHKSRIIQPIWFWDKIAFILFCLLCILKSDEKCIFRPISCPHSILYSWIVLAFLKNQ